MYSNLYDLITAIERGTKFHICVLFFGYDRSEKLMLPSSATTHTSPFCIYRKNTLLESKKCSECKNKAHNKARITKMPYSGYCSAGVFEYLHPIVIDDSVIAIVSIGNILKGEKGREMISSLCPAPEEFFDTMEKDTDIKTCEDIAKLLDSYIRMLIELTPDHDVDSSAPAVIRDVISYVEGNLNCEIDFHSLGENFHYNEKYLGRLFKRYTGKSLKLFVCEKRIEEAARLLRKTDLTITEISIRTGFGNVTYFNKRFLQFMEMTPTKYRAMNAQS